MSRTYTDDLKIIVRNEFRKAMKELGVEFVDCTEKYQEDGVIDLYIESMSYHIQDDGTLDYDIETYIILSLEYNEESLLKYIE